MTEPSVSDDDWPLNRRSALKLTGGLLLTGALGGQVSAVHGIDTSERVYRVKQGSREFEVTLLAGETPVRELYDLRIPNTYGGDNGATDPGEGPYYESVGLSYLLEESSTVTFLYDGPDGVSLVAVHGGGNSEGNVTWRVTGVPTDAKWLVKDDLYTYLETGEPAQSNTDRWSVTGSEHVIDWTWRNSQSDGGVLGYLDGDFALTIYPAYNEAATLYGETNEGQVTAWQFLTGSWNSLTRQSLNLQEPVTITCETTAGTETPVSSPETPEEETPSTPEETPEQSEKEEAEDKPEWKDDRDDAREERKEKQDEWQEKRDNGDDDWKDARDDAREEQKDKRDGWQDKRDEQKDEKDDKEDKQDKEDKKEKEKEEKKDKKDKKDDD